MISSAHNRTIRVGIFGGMGAIAGSAFYYKLTQAFQGLPEEVQPLVFLLSDPTMPRRDESVAKARRGEEPIVFKQKVLQGLAFFKTQQVDFVVVPCNTFHFFREEFEKKSGVRILDMIDIVVNNALNQKPDLKKIGLLSTEATAKAEMYQIEFAKKGVEVVVPNEAYQQNVSFVIDKVKYGFANALETHDALWNAVVSMLSQGIKDVILGCTELPEVPLNVFGSCTLIDTTQALVQGTVAEVERLRRGGTSVVD